MYHNDVLVLLGPPCGGVVCCLVLERDSEQLRGLVQRDGRNHPANTLVQTHTCTDTIVIVNAMRRE